MGGAAHAAAAQPALEAGVQQVAGDRLGQVVVHARVQAALAVAGHGVGGHGHDRQVAHGGLAGFDLAPAAGGRVTVQHRHLAVHQHQVVGVAGHLRQRDLAVGGGVAFVAEHRQQLLRHQQVDRVVFHQQQARRRAGRRFDRFLGRWGRRVERQFFAPAGDRRRGCEQAAAQVGVGGLARQDVGALAQFLGDGFLAVQPQQAHLGVGRVAAQGAMQGPGAVPQSVVVGQHRHEPLAARRGRLAQPFQGFLGGFHDAHRGAPVGQQQGDALAQAQVGGDGQHPLRVVRGLADAHVADHLQQRAFEPEGRTLAGFGVDADLAAHQVDDAFADGQAQAGAAVQAGGGSIGLGEGVEQALLLGVADADAGVAHLEAQLVLGGGFAQTAHVELDATALGELDRVADQVGQHLAQPDRVAAYRQAHVGVDVQFQAQALALGRALHQLHHRLEHFAQVEAGDLQLQPVGLQLGVVEDVVDDAQQLLRGFVRGAQHLALVRGQLAARDQVQHRDDAVERGADLVAHGGQELALGHGRRLGRALGLQQLLFKLIVAVDVALQQGAFVLGHRRPRLGLVEVACLRVAGQHRCQRQRRGGQRQPAGQPPPGGIGIAAQAQPDRHGGAGGGHGRQYGPDAAMARRRCHNTALWKSKSSSLPTELTRLPWM